ARPLQRPQEVACVEASCGWLPPTESSSICGGPWNECSRHDAHVSNQSSSSTRLQANMNSSDGQPYCVHGDPTYGMNNHLLSPYQAATSGPLTPEMKAFHKGMSQCRVTVE
ncbi:unnamed protein product, partial [Sphacelaria rigidula]